MADKKSRVVLDLSDQASRNLGNLTGRIRMSQDEVVGEALAVLQWVMEQKYLGRSIAAISVEQREYMPEFPFFEKLK
jgi:hypothetical protein